MDRELIKQVLREYLVRRLVLNADGSGLQIVLDELSQKLIDECTWTASISAGFDPDRACPQCQGPIEDGLEKCMRCFHVGTLRSYAERFHQIEATLNDAHPMFNDANAHVQGNPTGLGRHIRELHHWYIEFLNRLHEITHNENAPSRGAAQIPQRVESFEEFQRLFGSMNVDTENEALVRRHFERTETPLTVQVQVHPPIGPEHINVECVTNTPFTEEEMEQINNEEQEEEPPTIREWPIDDIDVNCFRGETPDQGREFLSANRHDFMFKAFGCGRTHHSSGRTSYEILGQFIPLGPERLRRRVFPLTIKVEPDHERMDYTIIVSSQSTPLENSNFVTEGALYDGYIDALRTFYSNLVGESINPNLELPTEVSDEELRDLFIPAEEISEDEAQEAENNRSNFSSELPKVFSMTKEGVIMVLGMLPAYLRQRVWETIYTPAVQTWSAPVTINIPPYHSKRVTLWIKKEENGRPVFHGWVTEHQGVIIEPRRYTHRDLNRNANIRRVFFDLLNDARNGLSGRILGRPGG